jgi:hypothetical protein
MAKKHDAPFVVDLPNASADQPSWLRVGIFAIVGLVVGIGWPRVFGIRLGPSAPVSAAEAQSGARPTDPPPALPANVVAASPVASGVNPAAMTAASSNAVEANASTVDVKHGVIVSCKTDTGETLKGAACGTLDFDAIALPHLKRLSHCPTADGADGKLSVLFGLDFESNKVRVDLGRSTNIENKDTFNGCLSSAFEKVSLGAMAHDNVRYTVSYSVHFAPRGSVTPATPGAGGTPTGGAPADTSSGSPTPSTASSPTADVAADSAEVVWQVAIVRDSPRTGNVVARLPRGSTVKIASNQEGWYRVHYGPSFGSEGWVYRASVGK